MPIKVSASGAFFQRDPVRTFRANLRDAMAEMAESGEADVKARMQQGEGSRQPMRGITPVRVSGHVVGRVRSLAGKPWAATAVVSINNRGLTPRQGITLMAAGSRIEAQSHPFRRAASGVRKWVRTDLAKGLE